MSADEAEKKNVEDETKDDDASAAEENGESDAPEEKVNNKTTPKKKAAAADPPKIKQPAKKRMKTEQAEKESKKEEKKDKKTKDVEKKDEKNDVSEDESDAENEKAVPLLDQPLEIEGSRRRKEVQRFIPTNPEEDTKELQIPEGKGKALGSIERIDFNIQRAKPEDLKLLHRLCFGRQCKAAVLKKNIKKFNGFDFEEASDEYEKRKATFGKNKKVTVSHLKNVGNILDIIKSGTKEDILERILSFLVCPVDSGKKLPGGGRSKRSGVSAKNYDEGDESYKSRKKTKAKKKDDESEEDSEKEKSDDDDDEEEEEKVKTNEKNKNDTHNSEDSKSDNEEGHEEDGDDEEEEEEEKKKPKKGAKKGKKAIEAAEKKAPPKKRAAAKKAVQEKSESEDEDEDEPLAKKAKTPPTDEEIKTYVKSLLEGANLELITMKKVCHDVYAHYPDFDLGHKKAFIKTTVKSLISS